MSDLSAADGLGPLGDMQPGSPIAPEWATYKRERPRLLAEGHEGRYVLIKGEEIIGIWDTRREAMSVGTQRFGLVPMLAHQIARWERTIRTGSYRRCLP